MQVRFAEAPTVVTYDLEEQERQLKRASQSNMNMEYMREKRLYSLVLKWKQANPQDVVLQLSESEDEQLVEFLGYQRAEVARSHGIQTLQQLAYLAVSYALDKWPKHSIDGKREYELTSMIVLNLVAEFICQLFRYELSQTKEQDNLYFNIFHLAQEALACYVSN